DETPLCELQRTVLDVLSSGGAWTAEEIGARAAVRMRRSTDQQAPDGDPAPDPPQGTEAWPAPDARPASDALRAALWGLAQRGLVTTDSFAPVRGARDAASAGDLGGRARGRAARGTGRGSGGRTGRRPSRTSGRGRRRLRTEALDSARFGASYGSAYRSLEPAAAAPPDPRTRGRWSAVAVERAGPTE